MTAQEKPLSPRAQLLWLAERRQISSHVMRIWLRGEGLAHFPADCVGAHLKLLFPQPGQAEPLLPQWGAAGPVWADAAQKPTVRTYTVQGFDGQCLAIDFVLHGVPGPAVNWARHAEIGACLGVSLPGKPWAWLHTDSHQLLAGDLTALPMLAALLAQLPAEAKGAAFISVPHALDIQTLTAPDGIEVHWLVDADPHQGQWSLAAQAWPWPQTTVCVTVAGEAKPLQQLRRYLKQQRQQPKEQLYAVPFWKLAQSEEGFHDERHQLMDE